MHITVVALGTRGDVQPILALGKGLLAAGHHVALIAGSNFVEWIRSHGLDAIPAVDMEAVMNSDKGRAWSESSANPLQQIRMMRALVEEHGAAMYQPILEAASSTDLLISGFTSEPFVHAVSEHTGVPSIRALLQPYIPTRSGAASLVPFLPRSNTILNRWMGSISERIIWSVSGATTNQLRARRLGLPPHTAASFLRASAGTPAVLGLSRHVVPVAPDWPTNTVVSGYWFLDEQTGWQPPHDLTRFLDAGPPPVYIGFGSMSSRDPQATLALIREAVRQADCRAIVATGWSGAHAQTTNDQIHMLDHAPHTWLFERVAAVVHHGGAGTTAAALRVGKPMMIVPHMSDQPYWGRRMHELGAGVKPIARHHLTVRTLAQGIRWLLGDARLSEHAQAIGQQIRTEDGVGLAVHAIERFARRV